MNTEPLLIACTKCNHPYSKRAEKCPKCGAVQEATCSICQNMIPMSAEVCPECGDPDPFGEIQVSPETTVIDGDRQQNATSNEHLDSSIAAADSTVVEKKADPVQRWTLIIGSVLGTLAIIEIIKFFLIDAGVRGPTDPKATALLATLTGSLPMFVAIYMYYRTKRIPESDLVDRTVVESHGSAGTNAPLPLAPRNPSNRKESDVTEQTETDMADEVLTESAESHKKDNDGELTDWQFFQIVCLGVALIAAFAFAMRAVNSLYN